MTEYKVVSLPTKGHSTVFTDTADKATDELSTVYVAQGWSVVNSMPSPVIGQIGFLLRRD